VRVKNVDILIQDLQKTIEALETLSDNPATAGDPIDELLDQLFQHKIDLVSLTLNTASPPYQHAAQAMKQAAAKAERAVQEPARIDEAAAAVASAIPKLAKLLDSVIPIN
jgi:hypothetical protein